MLLLMTVGNLILGRAGLEWHNVDTKFDQLVQ